MDRKINETFQDNGRTLQVVENNDKGYFCDRLGFYCNYFCYYQQYGSCNGCLQDSGDCQPRWRKDHTPVYFKPIDE